MSVSPGRGFAGGKKGMRSRAYTQTRYTQIVVPVEIPRKGVPGLFITFHGSYLSGSNFDFRCKKPFVVVF